MLCSMLPSNLDDRTSRSISPRARRLYLPVSFPEIGQQRVGAFGCSLFWPLTVRPSASRSSCQAPRRQIARFRPLQVLAGIYPFLLARRALNRQAHRSSATDDGQDASLDSLPATRRYVRVGLVHGLPRYAWERFFRGSNVVTNGTPFSKDLSPADHAAAHQLSHPPSRTSE